MRLLVDGYDKVCELWPEFLGGFVAYVVHTAHHKIFHVLARFLPRAMKGGHS